MMQTNRPGQTCTGNIQPKERKFLPPKPPEVTWRESIHRKHGEELLKNLAVAASLVLCAVVLRSGSIPGVSSAVDAVMTAATSDTLLDDRLGKLSFVSTLFPEATLVFGEVRGDILMKPVSSGEVVHAWNEEEPYMAWQTEDEKVCASATGEVLGVYHGEDEEYLVQVLGTDGIACLYGNLSECYVQTGDSVQAGDTLGALLPGQECIWEVRQDGRSIDPAAFLRDMP